MQQYLDLLTAIEERGTYKPAAREGMPGTKSLFGYQFRHDLSKGFPMLTTKKVFWKGVVVELLWFLKGDTNIKYLVDNGVNIWNEDAYNYYEKLCKQEGLVPYGLESFIDLVKEDYDNNHSILYTKHSYRFGDCGFQYGKVWRSWEKPGYQCIDEGGFWRPENAEHIDQISNLISSLKNNPESRRHIITAVDPAHDTDLALYWCHAMFQFNCRPLTFTQRHMLFEARGNWMMIDGQNIEEAYTKQFDIAGIPKYYLDCQLYQRSADVVLGVPFNIASYALLTEIIAKMCNMIAGEFVHTFGDVHIYDDHKAAVAEQLTRKPTTLPKLVIKDEGNDWAAISNLSLDLLGELDISDFTLENYTPQPAIKAKLSTGLK